MLAIPRWKFWIIIGTCLLGFLFALPNVSSPAMLSLMPSWLQSKINLGLELQGGSHLQLEVDLQAVARESLNQLVDDVRANLRKEQIGYTGLAVDKKAETPVLEMKLRNQEDAKRVKELLAKIDNTLTVTVTNGHVVAKIEQAVFDQRKKKLIEQSIEVIRRRIDESGTKEPILQRQGDDRIILQLPGVEDPGEVKRRIGKTAKMTFRLVDPTLSPVAADPANPGKVPASAPGVDYLPEDRNGQIVYIPVKKQVMVSGETLVNAQVTYDQNGQPAVSLKFNSIGGAKFANMSRDNLKKQFAIVLDNQVISAPVFQSVINDGGGQISGHFELKTANDLALLLRAGALPAPLKIIEEKTVGPSLGADSIRAGQTAVVLAFVLVSLFMFLSYSTFGLFANIALTCNLVFLFAGLSLLQATLTLPGIAGIALTIGMAVDANVLIYERIKEELRSGVKPVTAVDAGYKRAMMTIIDSNLTTLFGAAVLFEFGSGPIRGFAVTLALGILISLFTSLSLSRLIIVTWLRNRKATTLPI
ncbi:MAG: protein translocase subunit SecD [Candidatus Paracaedibacteraceae bacterium]|nr:protein translocase subunit SecD [Candidatus Paracaedibacteraceae bacterium]